MSEVFFFDFLLRQAAGTSSIKKHIFLMFRMTGSGTAIVDVLHVLCRLMTQNVLCRLMTQNVLCRLMTQNVLCRMMTHNVLCRMMTQNVLCRLMTQNVL